MKEKKLTISELKKEEYIPYLTRIAELTHDINIPYEYIINNKKYLICEKENNYIITSKNKDEVDLYSIIFDDNKEIIGYSKNELVYSIYLEKEFPNIGRINAYTNKIDEIIYGNLLGRNEGLYLMYNQNYIKEKEYLNMQYDMTNFNLNNFKLHLRYIKNDSPYLIEKKDGFFSKNYIAVTVDNQEMYSPTLMFLKIPIIINVFEYYTKEEIIGDKYNITIPTDLTDLALNDNNEFNTLTNISNHYQRILKR